MIPKQFLLIPFLALTVVLSCNTQSAKQPVLKLDTGWKFMNHDDLAYARADFDDSEWPAIRVDKTWDKQGYTINKGIGWYRIKLIFPSSLKKRATLKDSLIFHLGKIDDFDQVFLNGELIAENLKSLPPGVRPSDKFKDLKTSSWDVERRYALAANDPRIHWDKPNVIAVRVYNWGGPGGIYSGHLYLAFPDISEYARLSFEKHRFQAQGDQLRKTLRLRNISAKYNMSATLNVAVKNNISNSLILKRQWTLNLAPKSERNLSFHFPRPRQSAQVHYQVDFKEGNRTLHQSEGVPYILTPPQKPEPRINGALVYGQRPGRPFLFRIAATGQRPMEFVAQGLPDGLFLDSSTGIIKGAVTKPGTYPVAVTVKNAIGSARKTIRFVIGDQLALTPPMGWNSWNVWGLAVTQERVLAAARAFVATGLINHGWTYINIDDGWEIPEDSDEAKRKANGEIRTNDKFPDIKKLADEIHDLGLKLGIYSSPGPWTCGGYTGSYQHEELDALTFARWGVDYLKYDLCSYRDLMQNPDDPQELMTPYLRMYQALQKVKRDIVYSLCEYGNGRVWEWGATVGGNLWRTTGDIWDQWERMSLIGFNQQQAAPYAGPGHWNDPDMLVVGWLGWGEHLHYTRLTPDEQYTHLSLWALLSAPLLIGCDLQRLDDFTLNLLTNDEVLAIDQDPLGKQAVPVFKRDSIYVYQKPLNDANYAIGIFNISQSTRRFALDLRKLGIDQTVKIRDVWRQKDLGTFKNRFNTIIPPHGVTFIKLLINSH